MTGERRAASGDAGSGARRRADRRFAAGARRLIDDPYESVLTVWGGLANFALVGYQAVLVVFLVHDVRLRPGRSAC